MRSNGSVGRCWILFHISVCPYLSWFQYPASEGEKSRRRPQMDIGVDIKLALRKSN